MKSKKQTSDSSKGAIKKPAKFHLTWTPRLPAPLQKLIASVSWKRKLSRISAHTHRSHSSKETERQHFRSRHLLWHSCWRVRVISTTDISVMFEQLRPTKLARKEILAEDKISSVTNYFDKNIQLNLAKELAVTFGYDSIKAVLTYHFILFHQVGMMAYNNTDRSIRPI